MIVKIEKSELLFDIRNKSHADVKEITDVEQRYNVEAGTEKYDEIERSIINAMSKLRPSIQRYLVSDFAQAAYNEPGLPDVLTLDFSFSERRLDGKAQPLTDAIHSFLVNETLSLFYDTVGADKMKGKRSAAALEDKILVEQLVFTKKAPYISNH